MSETFELLIEISADGTAVSGTVHGIAGHGCEGIAALLDKVGEEVEHYHTEDWDKQPKVRWGQQTQSWQRVGK